MNYKIKIIKIYQNSKKTLQQKKQILLKKI